MNYYIVWVVCVLDSRDTKILKDKYFSLLTDESTNISNTSDITLIVRFLTDCGEIKVLF